MHELTEISVCNSRHSSPKNQEIKRIIEIETIKPNDKELQQIALIMRGVV